MYQVESVREGSQRDDSSHDSPIAEGEPPLVEEENSSSAKNEPSDMHTGGIQGPHR